MTTRGRPPGLVRPTTPPDPTLNARPVPSYRNFVPLSFGQGAASELTVRSLQELDTLLGADPQNTDDQFHLKEFDTVHNLLEQVERHEQLHNEDEVLGRDPTWGFYVFVTDYSPTNIENIPRAMENLVKAVERSARDSPRVYMDEASRRFKLDVVEDKEALSGASDDRVREEFRAHLRTTRLLDSVGCIWPPARNMACFVLDRTTTSMLANLSFIDGNQMDEYKAFEGKSIKVVDSLWERPHMNTSPDRGVPYRGVDHCPLYFILSLYLRLTKNTHMRDLYPMHDMCY
jgi:hypothetical protein